jgi:hypothetical protein
MAESGTIEQKVEKAVALYFNNPPTELLSAKSEILFFLMQWIIPENTNTTT